MSISYSLGRNGADVVGLLLSCFNARVFRDNFNVSVFVHTTTTLRLTVYMLYRPRLMGRLRPRTQQLDSGTGLVSRTRLLLYSPILIKHDSKSYSADRRISSTTTGPRKVDDPLPAPVPNPNERVQVEQAPNVKSFTHLPLRNEGSLLPLVPQVLRKRPALL